MSPTALLDTLKRLDVHLEANGDRLKVDAPKGVLTPKMKAVLAEHKTALLAILGNSIEYICPTCNQPAKRLGNYQQADGFGRFHCGLGGCLVLWRRADEVTQ